jgi:hypothetical protein
LTTDEALKLCQDYDICGIRLPYRDAKLAPNVAGLNSLSYGSMIVPFQTGILAGNTGQRRVEFWPVMPLRSIRPACYYGSMMVRSQTGDPCR